MDIDFHLHLPDDLHAAVTEWARRHGQSRAAVVRRSIEFALGLEAHPEFFRDPAKDAA